MSGLPARVIDQRPDLLTAAPAGRSAIRRALLAIVRRDLAGRRLSYLSLLLDLTFGVTSLLVFLFISRVLRPADGAHLGSSGSYFDFVGVGIVFMLAMQAACFQLTSQVSAEQRAGTLEMLAAQPAPNWILAIGLAAYPMLFALLRACVYLAILGLMLGRHTSPAQWAGAIVVMTLGAAAMTGVGIGLMAVTVAVGHGDAAARVLIVGLSFVSGTYFPVTALWFLPHWLTAALPSRIALDGLRQALSGHAWGNAAGALLAATAVLLPLSIWLFDRAIRVARGRGALTRD